jgi:hypothetical protein
MQVAQPIPFPGKLTRSNELVEKLRKRPSVECHAKPRFVPATLPDDPHTSGEPLSQRTMKMERGARLGPFPCCHFRQRGKVRMEAIF